MRCYCGHPHDMHIHYRRGRDCGACECHRYVGRDQPLPQSHRELAAVNDAHAYRNLWLLSQFTQSSRPPPAIDIPRQRRQHVSDYLDQRRAQARKENRDA